MRRPQKGAPFKGIIFDFAGNRMTPLKAARPGKTTYRYYVSSPIQAGRRQDLGAVPRISAHIVEEIVATRLHELKLCILTGGTGLARDPQSDRPCRGHERRRHPPAR